MAGRVGGKAIVLAQEVKAISGIDTYEKLFEYNIEGILAAFKEVGVKPNQGD
ncbi:MAG: hypothetical protein IID42_04640 [Planctomycetes bacterium]|nr:hypothetical protein [Planctomycetota bacterium]